MKILPLFLLLACVALVRSQEDGEVRSIGRLLPKRGPPKSKTSTTTTPPPQEEVEYEDEDYPAEGEVQEASTEAPSSTTEGKKLVGSGQIRPFRSNTDLLDILKKKRAQAAESKLHGSITTTQSPAQDSLDPAKSSYNKSNKKRFNNVPVPREVTEEEAPTPKPIRGRFGRPATRSVQTEEEPVESAPAVRSSRQYRRGGF